MDIIHFCDRNGSVIVWQRETSRGQHVVFEMEEE